MMKVDTGYVIKKDYGLHYTLNEIQRKALLLFGPVQELNPQFSS